MAVDMLSGYHYHTLPSLAVGIAMSEESSTRYLLVHDSEGTVMAAVPVEVIQPYKVQEPLQLYAPCTCMTQEGCSYLQGLEMVTGMKGGRTVINTP